MSVLIPPVPWPLPLIAIPIMCLLLKGDILLSFAGIHHPCARCCSSMRRPRLVNIVRQADAGIAINAGAFLLIVSVCTTFACVDGIVLHSATLTPNISIIAAPHQVRRRVCVFTILTVLRGWVHRCLIVLTIRRRLGVPIRVRIVKRHWWWVVRSGPGKIRQGSRVGIAVRLCRRGMA